MLVQASPYYKFAATVLLAMGVVFQVPVAILAATRGGNRHAAAAAPNRRYAIVACAAIAAFLPGDAITLLLETVPLYVLYEASILLASFVERSREARAAEMAADRSAGGAPEGRTPPRGKRRVPPRRRRTQTVREQIIDHIDSELTD